MKGIFILHKKEKNKGRKVAINRLTFKEPLILEKSIEKFNDPNPCIIHKTWCINYLAFELQDLINKKHSNLINVEILRQAIPTDILNYIELEEDIYKISIK